MKFREFNQRLNEKMLKPTSPKMRLQMAIAIALDMGGNMTGAYKKIEKIEKGLGDHPAVKAALRFANEDVNEKMSKADKKKRLQMIARAVEKMKEKLVFDFDYSNMELRIRLLMIQTHSYGIASILFSLSYPIVLIQYFTSGAITHPDPFAIASSTRYSHPKS